MRVNDPNSAPVVDADAQPQLRPALLRFLQLPLFGGKRGICLCSFCARSSAGKSNGFLIQREGFAQFFAMLRSVSFRASPKQIESPLPPITIIHGSNYDHTHNGWRRVRTIVSAPARRENISCNVLSIPLFNFEIIKIGEMVLASRVTPTLPRSALALLKLLHIRAQNE
jgi:hypothetical protein